MITPGLVLTWYALAGLFWMVVGALFIIDIRGMWRATIGPTWVRVLPICFILLMIAPFWPFYVVAWVRDAFK